MKEGEYFRCSSFFFVFNATDCIILIILKFISALPYPHPFTHNVTQMLMIVNLKIHTLFLASCNDCTSQQTFDHNQYFGLCTCIHLLDCL